MNYTIQKGSSRTMYLFILTGIFLIVSFGYNLYIFLQTNEFVYEFPGDWDKPAGIAVGLFLIIRSRKFVAQSKGLFIKTDTNHLVYRTRHSDKVCKINLSTINRIQDNDDVVIIETNKLSQITIDLSKVSSDKEKKEIIKSLFELI